MIAQNIAGIRQRINAACVKIGRNPQQITLIAVSKGRSIEQIKEGLESGITDIGESRVQEAICKHTQLVTPKLLNSQILIWHMIGHLQTNKAKESVKIFDLIQSVDSLRLAAEIDAYASKINKIQDILVEVNASGDREKYGFSPEETRAVIKEIAEFKNLSIKGLMAIAPTEDNPQKTRLYFRILRELQGDINRRNALRSELTVLSMGMSDDFEVAIEEGATMLRLGRAIFEG